MTKKDIALSVGGVLATMVLAYLLYRLQQRDSAASAAAAAEAQTQAEMNTEDVYSLLSTPSYGGATEAYSSPSISDISTSPELNSSGDTENDNGAGDSVISQLLGDLTSTLTTGSPNNNIIPTLNSTSNNALTSTSVPTSAGAALNQAGAATTGGGGATQGTGATAPNTLPRNAMESPSTNEVVN